MENKQRRGRKPKGKIIQYTKVQKDVDAPIIAHLPIEYIEDNDIFIKSTESSNKSNIACLIIGYANVCTNTRA